MKLTEKSEIVLTALAVTGRAATETIYAATRGTGKHRPDSIESVSAVLGGLRRKGLVMSIGTGHYELTSEGEAY